MVHPKITLQQPSFGAFHTLSVKCHVFYVHALFCYGPLPTLIYFFKMIEQYFMCLKTGDKSLRAGLQ